MSAEKSSRKNAGLERKRLRNKSARTMCKTQISKAETLVFSGELESARTAVLSAISCLDKAGEKGVLHPNNTARRKSRLIKKLNAATAASSQPEAEST